MIKILFLLIFLISCNAFNSARGPANEDLVAQQTYDIIYDLDWTVLYNLPEGQPHIKGHRYLSYQGINYRIVDWFEESVMSLLNVPGVRISVFTGGKKDRTDYLLKNIILPDGTRLYDRIYKNLEYDDLTPQKFPKGEAFFDKYKKDLSRYFTDMNNTIIVEDAISVPTKQRKNLLWLQQTYEFQEKFIAGQTGTYDAPTFKEFRAERNKIVWAYDIIIQGLNKGRETGVDLVTAVEKISQYRNGKLKQKTQTDQLKRVQKAIGKFRLKYGKADCLDQAIQFSN